jgi:hypothetical protein
MKGLGNDKYDMDIDKSAIAENDNTFANAVVYDTANINPIILEYNRGLVLKL